jgi:hypothetical protein
MSGHWRETMPRCAMTETIYILLHDDSSAGYLLQEEPKMKNFQSIEMRSRICDAFSLAVRAVVAGVFFAWTLVLMVTIVQAGLYRFPFPTTDYFQSLFLCVAWLLTSFYYGINVLYLFDDSKVRTCAWRLIFRRR